MSQQYFLYWNLKKKKFENICRKIYYKVLSKSIVIEIKNPICMFKGRLDKDEEIISEFEDTSEDIISKEVQRSKGQKEIWGRIRNMEDRVNILISYAEIEGSENVAVNNIWLHIAWKYSITDESPW